MHWKPSLDEQVAIPSLRKRAALEIDNLDEICRADDPNSLELAEDEEVFVPSDEVVNRSMMACAIR